MRLGLGAVMRVPHRSPEGCRASTGRPAPVRTTRTTRGACPSMAAASAAAASTATRASPTSCGRCEADNEGPSALWVLGGCRGAHAPLHRFSRRRDSMARYERLPIYGTAFDLAVHIEKIVRNFSRYPKYTLGTALRDGSRRILERIIEANHSRARDLG